MSEYKLSNEAQLQEFIAWRKVKLSDPKNKALGSLNSGGGADYQGFYEIDLIDGEMIGRFVPLADRRQRRVHVSGEPEKELLAAGVIFESSELKTIKDKLANAIEQTEEEIRRISPRLVDRMEPVDHSSDFVQDTGVPNF